MALKETFKPGLFDIGLNIEKRLSHHELFIESKKLHYHIRFKPIYIKPVIRNLQAVLLFHMDSGRMDARLMLEELNEEYPKDLNVLADLIYIYKRMGRERDSNWYKKKLELYKEDPLLQAKSILSQANALNYDLTDEHKSPKVLLKDTWRQLSKEDNHLEQVNKAIDLVVDAYKVVNTIPQIAYGKAIVSKEIAVEKFESGIKILEKFNRPKEEILAWKHNLANARGKLENWRSKINDDFNISGNCIKALETHLDVIENLSPIEHLAKPLKIYVARSYIYFAQLYMSRKYFIDKINAPERITRRGRNLDSMGREALFICPYDQTVLQRSGRYRYNKNEHMKAIELYDMSINQKPDADINWFSYACRSQAYYYYAMQLKKRKATHHTIYKNLEFAYNDLKVCIQSKRTVTCMISMAQICFERAMPDNNPGVSFHCQNIEFIYEALETIHETFNTRDITEYSKIHYLLGRFYPYVGEYRKAVESLKTALELNKWSQKYPVFPQICKCFMSFYKRENDKNLLSEFRFMLKEAKKRDCNKLITDAINILCKHNPKMLADLVQNMIEWDVRGCKGLIEEALNNHACQNLRKQFETKLEERNDQDSDKNGPMEIQKLQSTERFQYDFFVSHSEKDKDWVNCMLRPQLEDFDEEISFKGFIPSRDFVPGNLKIASMIDGITHSCKLLIVLTPNYLEDNWQKLVRNQMIFSVIETKVKEKTIIPIILEECAMPHELKSFTPILFTEESHWERLRASLTVNMDSETSLEERMAALTTCDIDED